MALPLPPPETLDLVQLAEIARGGMGSVELARVRGGRLDGRALAVKRLNPEVERDPEFVNMFLDETWLTSAIASPHVVRVEAWGRDAEGLFLAVELVQGVSLARLIKESKAQSEPFAERTVAYLVSQVCAGLEETHGLRGQDGKSLMLVHRDLTPGNILVGFDGLVKIADFGIAKAEARLTETRAGMMKGKPAYMAPEQAQGHGVDARADLFSLGVVMFELLAGKRPWKGTSDLELLVSVATSPPERLSEVRKTHAVFDEVIDRCLQKDPERRFSSAREVRERIDAWRREKGFDGDDMASLSRFVQRNTPQQIAWFQSALGGEIQAGGRSFKEVEESIDRGRRAARTSGGGVSREVAQILQSQQDPEEDAATLYMATPMAGSPPSFPIPSAPGSNPGGKPPSSGGAHLASTIAMNHQVPFRPPPSAGGWNAAQVTPPTATPLPGVIPVPVPSVPRPEPPRSSRLGMVALLFVLLLALAGAAAYYFRARLGLPLVWFRT